MLLRPWFLGDDGIDLREVIRRWCERASMVSERIGGPKGGLLNLELHKSNLSR